MDSRIDLLIYAHDGRGLGHASRGVAIGSAVRRLYPELKVLFLSGCKQTETLIGPAPLDWIKLPAYEKALVNGLPQGRIGNANLKNSTLVASRTRLIQSIVEEYRPRCVMVDHEARGRKAELAPAIENARDTIWILGLRGVIGQVGSLWSDTNTRFFKKYYQSLLWHGDDAVLGRDTLKTIEAHYQIEPVTTGYISRLREMACWKGAFSETGRPLAGTVAVSWESEASRSFLEALRRALTRIGDRYGAWRIYVNFAQDLFKDLPFCQVQDLSPLYLYSLSNSKMAVTYGGYNSLADILSVNIPAVVLLRDNEEREQEWHVKKLAALEGTSLIVMHEKTVTAPVLQKALETQLNAPHPGKSDINLKGSDKTAHILAEYIQSN